MNALQHPVAQPARHVISENHTTIGTRYQGYPGKRFSGLDFPISSHRASDRRFALPHHSAIPEKA